MATISSLPTPPAPPDAADVLPLETGDHLDRETFHRRYQAMPPDVKAELIGGMVYMPSPASRRHGRHTRKVGAWMDLYEGRTPGVEGYDNATVILADDGEPQPDACLLVSPDSGGQTRVEQIDNEDYIAGPPELVAEVASSTASYDLHTKKRDYEKAGVREYLVVLVREPRVLWFVNREGTFRELEPADDGTLRSEVFPGLWLDPQALLRLDSAAVRTALERGLATKEHAEFVRRLARAPES